MTTLQWGVADEKLKKLVPGVGLGNGRARCKNVVLQNFPGDCGALILTGANSADVESLKMAEEVASQCGFSKIFATVVTSVEYATHAAEAFKKARWIKVHKGKSNRTTSKDSYVFVKIIRNCKYKGY